MSKNDCQTCTSQDMSKILLLCGVIMSVIGPTVQTNYCAICENKSHTMCKYKRGRSDKCIGHSSKKMTPEIQNLIVGLHNEFRNNVASGREVGKKFRLLPPGEDVHALKWDKELAAIAQRWADQCVAVSETNQHDDCKTTDRFPVGQNVFQAIRTRSVIDFNNFLAGVVRQWYNEVDKVDPSSIVHFGGSANWNTHIGNFAQLVWAQTKYIGCAHTSFAVNSTAVLDRLVCNYGPSGNIIGNSIYKAGISCSKCRCGSKTYPALCCSPTDNLPRNKRGNIKTESGLDNSNIYKTNDSEFRLNHHLTQKLFQLFEKLNLTMSNNLLMQLNDIHNQYNISSEVQDISKHVEEPKDVAYFDELEFQNDINKTFEWEVVERMYKNQTVPTRQSKKSGRTTAPVVESTEPNRETPSSSTLKVFHRKYHRMMPTTTTVSSPDNSKDRALLMYQGDKCFCYYSQK